MDNLQTTYAHQTVDFNFFSSPEEHLDYLLTPKPISIRDIITPYFYIIKSKTLDAYYVGIKYSRKDSNPSKFWSEYQTSSMEIFECIDHYGQDDFEIVNVFDTDPHGNDWEFISNTSNFKLGQFETDSINVLLKFGIRSINKASKFGSKHFNPYAIMADGRTAGQWRAERSAQTSTTTILDNGLTIAQNGAIKSAQTSTTTILENGLTIAQNTGIKGAKTRTTTILENGLTIAQDNAYNGHRTKLTCIDDSGQSIMDKSIEKYKQTINIVQDNGLTIAQNKGIKGAKTRTTTILANGKSIAQNNSEVCAKNKKETIMSNGLSKMQNTVLKGAITRFGRVVYVYLGDDLVLIGDRHGLVKDIFKSKTKQVIDLFDTGGGLFVFHEKTYEIIGAPKKPEHQYIPLVV